MNDTSTSAAHRLLETGTLVLFRVVDIHTELSPDKENVSVRVELVFADSVTIRQDGSVLLTTWGRGQSALRWLDQLQGKRWIAAVSDQN